jgi:transposase-like protein/Zn ribbon nucleic-acid-binding protein
MINYPTTDFEFEATFKTEKDCFEYLISVRWPNGLFCPKCQHDNLWRNDDSRILECSACGHRLRTLAGTIFQDTHISLKHWFKAMWRVMSEKSGANATGLARILGLAHSTTWNMLHKLRRTMVRAEREKLGSIVEVDESFIGGLEEDKPGRGAEKKSLVIVAVELSPNLKIIGRIRLAVIPDASSSSIIPFIQKNVESGSTVITDGWKSYLPLQKCGFNHTVKVMKKDDDMLPHVHLVISLLKRWILGTFQGSMYHKNLDYYLDEYVFRFNRRKSKSRGKLFRRLMEQAVITPPLTRKELSVKAQVADSIGNHKEGETLHKQI